jgi:hypothetical protein
VMKLFGSDQTPEASSTVRKIRTANLNADTSMNSQQVRSGKPVPPTSTLIPPWIHSK